jgi:hypothetical protein
MRNASQKIAASGQQGNHLAMDRIFSVPRCFQWNEAREDFVCRRNLKGRNYKLQISEEQPVIPSLLKFEI